MGFFFSSAWRLVISQSVPAADYSETPLGPNYSIKEIHISTPLLLPTTPNPPTARILSHRTGDPLIFYQQRLDQVPNSHGDQSCFTGWIRGEGLIYPFINLFLAKSHPLTKKAGICKNRRMFNESNCCWPLAEPRWWNLVGWFLLRLPSSFLSYSVICKMFFPLPLAEPSRSLCWCVNKLNIEKKNLP